VLDFASDNYAPAHPDVLAAVVEANSGHAVSYGEDPWSARAQELLRAEFGPDSLSLLVFNGSAANVTCLRTLCAPWEAVICAQSAHIATDEGGAPEASAGLKLLTCPTPDGKLTPALVRPWLVGLGNVHSAQPRVMSVTQTTEVGTRYSLDELRALGELCADSGLLLHVDGARLANAAAGLGVDLGELGTGVGAAAVSFGGTKNGALGVEAAVFLDPAQAPGAEFVRKQHLQLASKHRYLAAQFVGLLTDGLWRRLAEHANAMAARLAAAVRDLPGVEITQPVQANALFVSLPDGVADKLREEFRFYEWDAATGVQRWMCAWDTTAEQVDEFAAAVRLLCAGGSR
jgi:threonine aldolase